MGEYKETFNVEFFSDKEVNFIKEYLSNNKSKDIEFEVERNKNGYIYEINIKCYKNPIHYSNITIHKLVDDYFLFRDNQNSQSTTNYYYKADQFEGLIKLLKQVVLYNF